MNQSMKQPVTFLRGLAFVAAAYILIKVIDSYHLIFASLGGMFSTISPFLMAFIFAYLLNPIIVFLERQFKLKRAWSVTFTYVGLLFLCYVAGSFLFPIIYQSGRDLISQLPTFAIKMQMLMDQWMMNSYPLELSDLAPIQDQIMTTIPKLTDVLTRSLSSLVGMTYSALMGTGNFLMAFIISIYVLLEKEKFISIVKKLIFIVFRKKMATHFVGAGQLFHANIGKYLIGKSLDSIFVGVCAIIGLSFIGAKYAVLLGVIFGIMNMIPFVGPIIGTLVAVGINLFYNPLVAFVTFIFLLIVQQVETLVIDPKVVGEKMGLNPFFTLLAVTIGGKFFGMFGMILSVPVMGMIKFYVTTFINQQYDTLYPAVETQTE
ncbi:AI-2E family transporter [Turicibacter sp. TJ11]|uniref:AI-2E family transporter n=1 Tax=Turicibacter sp. TJ11 TaxID=2806443 RepID=UPI001F4673B0|nr:AI-2E family transporter [Turicibacter sp. TJ11]